MSTAADKPGNILLDELSLEDEIRKILNFDNTEVYFEDLESTVIAYTINPVHKQKFAFCYGQGEDRVECLQQILEYSKAYLKENQTFEIEWMEKGKVGTTVSWFAGHNILDVLSKFFYDKPVENFTIFNVKLRPVA